MTSMDRIDAVRLAMSTHFVYRARKEPQSIPTEADLVRLHDERGGEEWVDLMDDLVRSARPFVSEDGTWSRAHGGRVTVETVSLDDVLAAARYARIQVETAAAGDYALVRAVSDALSAASRDIDAEAAEVLHQALTAEQGLH